MPENQNNTDVIEPGIILGEKTIIKPKDIPTRVLVKDIGRKKFVEHIVKPNIMQMPGLMVIDDPTGRLYRDYAKLLLGNGYTVKLFSTGNNYSYSNEYNPMDSLVSSTGNVSEPDIVDFVHALISICTEGMDTGPLLFGYTEMFLSACVMFVLRFYPGPMRNLVTIAELVKKAATRDDYREFSTELECEFRKMKEYDPDAVCFRYHDEFYLAGRKLYDEAIRLSMYILAPFERETLRNIVRTEYETKTKGLNGNITSFYKDEDGQEIKTAHNISFNEFGKQKTAVFVNTPPNPNAQHDNTGKFLRCMLIKDSIRQANIGQANVFSKIEDIVCVPGLEDLLNGSSVNLIVNTEKKVRILEHIENVFTHVIRNTGTAIPEKIIETEKERNLVTLFNKTSHPNFKKTGEFNQENRTDTAKNESCRPKDILSSTKKKMINEYLRI